MKVLEGEAAARYAYDLAAAVMEGRDRPRTDAIYISLEDFRIGNGRYFKELTERMLRMSASISDDVAVQEIARVEIAQVLAEAEVQIADTMFDLTSMGKAARR